LALKANPQAKEQADAARAEIEPIIDAIKQIEGAGGLNGQYQRARLYIWQARYEAVDATDKQTLRNEARSLIDGLSSRRPDWSLIPLALASIVEQEIQEKTDQKDIKALQESAANLYIRAIEQGQTNLAIVRRATDLLYATGRQADVSQL